MKSWQLHVLLGHFDFLTFFLLVTLFLSSEQQKQNQLLDGDSDGAIFALGTK